MGSSSGTGATRGPIVVAGDIAVDWFTWTVSDAAPFVDPNDTTENWRQHLSVRRASLPGGALLLAEMVEQALDPGLRPNLVRPAPGKPETLPADRFVHSFADLKFCPQSDNGPKFDKFVITALRGFSFTGAGTTETVIPPFAKKPHMLVLDDAGNGFRSPGGDWDKLFAAGVPDWVVLKLSRPLTNIDVGALWGELRPRKPGTGGDERPRVDADRLIVVVDADDLRHHGVHMTPRLSWERTAQDFIRNLTADGKLASLASCRNLIVRFGAEAVIHYQHYKAQPVLYFEPSRAEGDRAAEQIMIGTTASFTAALAAEVAKVAENDQPDLPAAIQRAMRASIKLRDTGFLPTTVTLPRYPIAECLGEEIVAPEIVAAPIPADRIHESFGFSWNIVESLGDAGALARRITLKGVEKGLEAPVAKFGKLVTADRREIESIRAIDNLFREYLGSPDLSKPLSIAVFGPPGSGKSFVVKQLASTIPDNLKFRRDSKRDDKEPKPLEFNLSQFTGLPHLIDAFHQIQSRVLTGETPLVFFDEFDTALDGQKLGWLKYFLAPMQDGEYRDGAMQHPIGRAILVFAGGTSRSFKDFSAALRVSENHTDRPVFVDAKGPDFVSRLRGHIDILGPSAVGDDDKIWPIRRAILLRARLKSRAPTLFDRGQQLAIEDGVLHAFLTTRDFAHGARSLEAILEMSRLSKQRRFTASCLPPRAQLALHVDADDFLDRVLAERLPDGLRETLGRGIHAAYRALRQRLALAFPDREKNLETDPSMLEWSDLAPEFQESNRRQADDIPRKLRLIGFYMAQEDPARPLAAAISEADIAKLAEVEHERYIAERVRAGWKSGDRNAAMRRTPFLEPWCDVEPYYQEYDRNAVRVIPELLAQAGYRMYQLK